MNQVFNTPEGYRDSLAEKRIIHTLLILAGLAFFLNLFSPGEKVKEPPISSEDFYYAVQEFFTDSLSGYHLSESQMPDDDSPWSVTFSGHEGKGIQSDLFRFGLFCGDHLKQCTVRKDSESGAFILSLRDHDGKKTGIIRLIIRPEIIKGRVVLIIDDFGYAFGDTERGFLNLNRAVTFSVIPGHSYSKSIAREAYRRGHPVMIHMPMEPLKYYGGEEEYMIMDGMGEPEIEYRISKAMEDLPMAEGMNNHMGSRVTGSPEMIHKIAHVLEKKNLYFVDSYTVNGTVVFKTMKAHNIRVFERNIFLDHDNTDGDIRRQIRKMARLAERKGMAVAIGHNRPLTLKVLQEMIPKLEKEGFVFISPEDL